MTLQREQPPIRSAADALLLAERALAATSPGCSVVLTPHLLQLLVDAARDGLAASPSPTAAGEGMPA